MLVYAVFWFFFQIFRLLWENKPQIMKLFAKSFNLFDLCVPVHF